VSIQMSPYSVSRTTLVTVSLRSSVELLKSEELFQRIAFC